MQAFKSQLKILKKNLGGVMIYLVIFIGITILYSNLTSDPVKDTFSMKKLKVAVIDRDNTELSKGFKDYIGSIHKIVDVEDDIEALQDNLFYRNVSYILIIPKGYQEKLSQGIIEDIVQNVKVPNSFEGTFADRQVDQYLKTMSSYLKSGVEPTKSLTLTKGSLEQETEVTLLSKNGESNTSDTSIMFFFFQFMPYVLLCVILCGLGPILLVFNKPDLKKRIDVSSLSLKTKNRQMISFCIFFSIAVWFAFMLAAIVMNGSKMFSTAALLCMANSFIYTLVCISITYLVTLLIKSNGAINIISNVLGLGMSFLSGIFVPQSIMSEQVVRVSRILPGYWYINAHNTLMEYSGTTSEIRTILADFGVLLVFAVVILAISLVVSKVKHDNV